MFEQPKSLRGLFSKKDPVTGKEYTFGFDYRRGGPYPFKMGNGELKDISLSEFKAALNELNPFQKFQVSAIIGEL